MDPGVGILLISGFFIGYGTVRETPKARKAFDDYYALGVGRSLHLLHRKYVDQSKTNVRPPTRHLSTLKRWSSEHKWQERIWQKQIEIEMAQFEAIKLKAIEAGYAYWPKRVKDLIELADLLLKEIKTEDKRWVPDVKQIGSGEFSERVDIVRYNSSLIQDFMRALEHIAAEMGERVKKIDMTADLYVKGYEFVSPDDWDEPDTSEEGPDDLDEQ